MTRARTPHPHEVTAARRDPRLLRAIRDRQIDTAWRTRGACRTVDPETFFPAPSEAADGAVSMCRNCDVQGACLAWALDVGDCHGVWGATTPRERRAMLIAWRGDEDKEDEAAPAPVRRLETLERRDGIHTIMAHDRVSAVDLRSVDLSAVDFGAGLRAQDLALSGMAAVDAIAAAESIAAERLTGAETVGAAAS
jgi:WhiB family redox-sensing transcriptional regulator